MPPFRLAAALTAVTITATVTLAPTPAEAGIPALIRMAEKATPGPVQTADYGRFERMRALTLSPDGRWLAYAVSRVDRHAEVRLQDLEASEADTTDDSADGDDEAASSDRPGSTTYEHASLPRFSPDGRWFATITSVSADEREQLRERNKPVPSTLVLRDLTAEDAEAGTETLDDVGSIDFSEDGRWMVIRRGGTQATDGIVVRDLETGVHTSFPGVSTAAWSDTGALLAMVVSASVDADRNLQIYDPASGRLRTIDHGGEGYAGLTWRDDAMDLAIMREHEFEDGEDSTYSVLAFRDVDGDDPERLEWNHLDDDGGDAFRVVTTSGLSWSEDGRRLFFGTKDWEDRPAELVAEEDEADADDATDADTDTRDGDSGGADEGDSTTTGDAKGDDADGGETLRDTLEDPAIVDVWHSKDVDIIPLQRRRAGFEERQSRLSVLHLGDMDFVVLGADDDARMQLSEDGTSAVAMIDEPYEELQRFGPTLYDVHAVDLRTGERDELATEIKYVFGMSPDGRFLLWQQDGDLMSTDLESFETENLTGDLGVSFVNDTLTNLTDEKPLWGTAGFTDDSRWVFVNDQYDVWKVSLEGRRATRLTDGRDDSVVHRLARWSFDPDERHFDADGPWHATTYGEWTKDRGVSLVHADGDVDVLHAGPTQIGAMAKADDADVYAWTEEAFDDPTDAFVARGIELADPEQVTEMNPFFADYQWGRAELVDYENARGERMQGALYYPAGYEEGRQYPMVTYIYERLSQNIHRFTLPSETSPYNAAVYTSEGYFVFMPDITYRAQEPGVSAVECVIPAVEAVLATGKVDPERVGIMGHSWGAYQTAYLVTHTDTFATGVAGAPLTNMISMSMSVYWNSGQTNAWIFHESQGRMDQPFWNDLDTYVRNSPIFGIDDMDVPLLVAFGDEDGAVDWQQGVEMYNAARLAGKDLVMLVYEGENHGLRQRPNQVDYHHRIRTWMGHFLKDQSPEPWITEGVSWRDRQKELEAKGQNARRGPAGRPGTARNRAR